MMHAADFNGGADDITLDMSSFPIIVSSPL